MSKLSIVLTYYQRQKQLNKTLESFKQYNPDDFNVIIVDDASPDDIILPELSFEVIIIKLENKTWANTASVYNVGFIEALKYNPEIIIIQNAECLHWGDILGYAEKVTDETYISFACFSLAEGESECDEVIKDKAAEFNGDSAWYNHPIYRPVGFHFCVAITTKNLRKINGFDERFCDGVAFEDNMFIHQIRNLGLKIEITERPMVFHQWHYDGSTHKQKLVEKNKELWLELEQCLEFRAVHTITPDL